jgi:Fe-S oxidoreductase
VTIVRRIEEGSTNPVGSSAYFLPIEALLEHVGYQVIVPSQKEADMPAIKYGMLDNARSLARYP